MKTYPQEKFPKTVLRPEVVARHSEHQETLSNVVERYSAVGYRDTTIFDWLLRVFENTALSTVRLEYLDSLAITKTKISMFVIMIDDTVDNVNKRNFALYEQLLKVPFDVEHIDSSGLTSMEEKYLQFTKDLWFEIAVDAKKYPYYKKYKDAFEFDLKQILSSMEYSRFVNTHPNAANLLEIGAYVHHAMIVLLQLDLDLMCSEGFDEDELGSLRELAYLCQKMARIGNVIGTYPRELVESDMSSEASIRFNKEHSKDFWYKINKVLNREVRYPKFEEELEQEWKAQNQQAKEMAKKIKSIDTEKFLLELQFVQDAYKILVEEY